MPHEREIFSKALEIEDLDARYVYLDTACGSNFQLRQQIDLLLEAALIRDDFMNDSPLFAHLDGEAPTTSSPEPWSTLHNEQVVPDYLPGTTFSRYRIERQLGKGGMATVYLATDLRLKRAVALKIPRQLLLDEPELLQRFEREAHTMASVEHPNLCRVFDIGEQDNIPFLSMSYIEGETLAAALDGGRKYAPKDAVELVRKLALATHVAHCAGVVHRDLKPANVMIDQHAEPIIMDFGLALVSQLDSRLTRNGLIMGTPAYMAPEQAVGDPNLVGPQSDVYSLGAILYELLAGKPLYQGTTVSVLAQLVTDSQVSQRLFDTATVDWRLQAICMKALAKDVKERYASAQQLAVALSNFLNGIDDIDWKRSQTAQNYGIDQKPRSRIAIVSAIVVGLLSICVFWLVIDSTRGTQSTVANGGPENQTDAVANLSWSEPIRLGNNINSELSEENPTLSADGKILVFNRPKGGALQLWESRRKSVDVEFGIPAPLPETINLPGYIHDCPFLSADGLTLWFASNRPGGMGKHDIWFTQRSSLDADWGPPTHLGEDVNTKQHDQTPYVSDDGLTLYFSRDVIDGVFHLLKAERKSVSEPFSKTELVDHVNVGDCSSFPRLTSDGRQIIFAHSPTASRKLMIYTATRESQSGAFRPPFLMTDKILGANCSAPFLSADGMTLYFSSRRPNSVGGSMDLWMTRRTKSP